ncbi:MAG: hypothetical protein HRT45_10005 [Bdellovibrionales bacterium]|nr:hypothetical protein [Bdellovibrionales bacterium]
MALLKVAGAMLAASLVAPAFATDCSEVGTPVERNFDKPACMLNKSPYISDLTLTNDHIWVLTGKVAIVGDNQNSATLLIQPGTKLVGDSGKDYLLIRRGSQIVAQGTANAPIVMTSSKPVGQRSRGDWGGLVISGNAPVNGCGLEDQNDPTRGFCELKGEGDSGLYGGGNPEDSSGVLEYVVVEYAGNEVTKGDELNGIAFQGVGSGTEVNYVQVHMGFDDGFEFFGGTVNAKHLVSTCNKDDSLDWVFGWQGKAQFVLIKQCNDFANNGIEADNNDDKRNSYPRSMPTLSNMTILGATGDGEATGQGILLREGTGAKIYNTIVKGFKKSCLDIDDAETMELAGDGESLIIESSIVDCATNFETEDFDITSWFQGGFGNMATDPMLVGHQLGPDSPAIGAGEPPFDIFFDFADYIGAFDGVNDWTENANGEKWISTAVK